MSLLFPQYPKIRLAKLARLINALGNGFQATIEKSFTSTDRKPLGCRYITKKGKGRTGTRIIIRDPQGVVVLDHDSAETYRENGEVLAWVEARFGKIWETS